MFIVIIMLLICSIFLVGCKQDIPEIATTITLSNITKEEYQKISDSSKPEDASMDDFKNIYINVKITNSKKAIEHTISIPNLNSVIDHFDRIRTSRGGFSKQNNIGTEDTEESTAYVIFDSRGLSEQDIKNIFNESEINVVYRLKNSDRVESRVSIGKNLKIDN